LADGLAQLRLSLNDEKSALPAPPPAVLFPDPTGYSPQERKRAFREAVSESEVSVRWLKRLLRAYEETADPGALSDLPALVSAHPVLAPRAAAYVGRCAGHPDAIAALEAILGASHSAWISARFLAAAVHSRAAATAIPARQLTALVEGAAVLAPRCARVDHAAGRTWSSEDARLAAALRMDYDDLRQALPILATTL
jgi:hypothetical protein